MMKALTTILLLIGLASTARADCVDDAAAYHRVNPLVLRAILWHESRMRPDAINRNRNGSIDYGVGQINSIHLAELRRWGIAPQHLMEPCINTYVAAWHYRKMVGKYGNTWNAVGAYHSETPEHRDRYKSQIQGIVARWTKHDPAKK